MIEWLLKLKNFVGISFVAIVLAFSAVVVRHIKKTANLTIEKNKLAAELQIDIQKKQILEQNIQALDKVSIIQQEQAKIAKTFDSDNTGRDDIHRWLCDISR